MVIILVGKLYRLFERRPAANIWVAFGTGNNFKHIHINAVCNYLGKEKSTVLPAFHSFTGCDTTSSFFGKGKKSAWEAWNSFSNVTCVFLHMASHPHAPMTIEINCWNGFVLLCMTRQVGVN